MRNLLRRLRPKNPHTELITGVKSALRDGNEKDVIRLLSSAGKRIGLPASTRSELAEIITGRLGDTLSHRDATTAFHTLANTLPDTLPTDTLLTLENIARSIGCFHASHHFTTLAHHHIHHTPHPSETRFLAHLHHRNLTGAIDTYYTAATHNTPFWADAAHYLWLWSQGSAGTPHHTTDHTWASTLTGHHITILGPAPTTHTPPHTPHHLVARVLMQNVLSWDKDTDPFGGQADLGYVNRETRNWLLQTQPRAQLEKFLFVSFREDGHSTKWRELGLERARVAGDPRRLMLSGSSPNMIPLMMWDVLGVPDVTVTIAGTTFFATKEAYSPGNRRFKHTLGADTDETGSTGTLFERCPTFARHNVVDNLSLVANLVDAGVVGIDGEGKEVIDLTIPDYLLRLDELYGRERR
jgi:hypothetical protein